MDEELEDARETAIWGSNMKAAMLRLIREDDAELRRRNRNRRKAGKPPIKPYGAV